MTLSLRLALLNGQSLAGGVVTYLSFFTILTNLLTTLAVTLALPFAPSRAGRFFRRPDVSAAVAVYIAMVGLVYSLLLRQTWQPEGLQRAADILLHDLMPVGYCAYWLAFAPKGGLQWRDAFRWLWYPFAYSLYTLLRGAATGRYPYPFINVADLGYPRALLHALFLLAAFLALGLGVVAVGRLLSRRISGRRA